MALDKDAWSAAAFDALAEGGPAAVAVEPLAARLGATKGSFYWHFPNRGALLEAALERWEHDLTDEPIARLGPVEDGRERLRLLLAFAMGDPDDARSEAPIMAAAADPVVGPVLERVTAKRLAFLELCFRDLGHARAEARRRARLTLSAYLGAVELARIDPARTPGGREHAAYLRTMLRVLLG